MKRNVLYALFALCVCCGLTSCYVERVVVDVPGKFLYNFYDTVYKGKTKKFILLNMPESPKKVLSDGEGGEVLVYEKAVYITDSKSRSESVTTANSEGFAVAGSQSLSVSGSEWLGASVNGDSWSAGGGKSASGQAGVAVAGALFGSKSSSKTVSSGRTHSKQTEELSYVNFFVDSKGVCTAVRANIGDIYSEAITHVEKVSKCQLKREAKAKEKPANNLTSNVQIDNVQIDGISYEIMDYMYAIVKFADPKLRSVIIPEFVEVNGVPYPVESIGKEAFARCMNLEHVVIPNNMKRIGRYAFMNCKKLKRIEIPDIKNVLIYSGCFQGCNIEQFDAETLELLNSCGKKIWGSND